MKIHIKKDDTVIVLAGNGKGKTGRILSVDAVKNRARVEGDGIAMVKKHNKPSAESPDGGIVEVARTIHLSNLMLVDANGTASRIKRGKNDKGNSVRVSVKTGEEIK